MVTNDILGEPRAIWKMKIPDRRIFDDTEELHHSTRY
jgi:hypothetical protein